MATSGKAHGKNLAFKLDNSSGVLKDISTYVRSVGGLPGEAELGDVTASGDAGHKQIVGLKKATITLECVFDDTADSAWNVVQDFQDDSSTRSFEYGPAGETSGYAKVSGECRISKVDLPVAVTDPLLLTVELMTDGDITVGTWT